MLVIFKDGKQWRPWSKPLLDYYMASHNYHCCLFGIHYIMVRRPPGLPFSDVISPSLAFTLLERKKEEREEGERMSEGGRWTVSWGVFTPAGLPGKATDLASHHTQPASAYVWACMWVHLLARECVYLCVTGRMHKEGRIVSKQRIRKDNRECVRRQRVKKKHLLNVMKEVMRSVTMEEGFTGAGEEKQKGVIYYI